MASAVNNNQQSVKIHKEEVVGLTAVEWETPVVTPIVQVEYCLNCEVHSFKHSSVEYYQAFEKVQRFFQKRGYQVRRREAPKHLYRQSPYWPTNSYINMQNGQSEQYPQEGAFEIYLGNTKLFSRLETKRWPYTKELLTIIDSIKHSKQSSAQQQRFIREESSNSKQRYLHWLKKTKQSIIQQPIEEKAFHRPNSKRVYRIPSRSRTISQTRQLTSQHQNRNLNNNIQHSVQVLASSIPSRNSYFKRNTLQIEESSKFENHKLKVKKQQKHKNHSTQRYIQRIYLEDIGPLKKIWRFDLQHRRQNLRQKCEQFSDRSKMALSGQTSKNQ